jgi:SAM-dependent methyltransferase
MSENFNTYSRYYDLLYRNKKYKEEADYVVSRIRSFNPGAKSVLELGCGTGNHAIQLSKAGFTVTGIERSGEMAALAMEKNIPGFEAVTADITDFDLSSSFDAVISLFHVISYLTDNQSLISCFKNAANHLKDGGIFLFDIWYSPAVYWQKPETRVKRLSDNDFEITRIAEPVILSDKNVVEVNYEIIIRDKQTGAASVFVEKHPMRHFSIPEIELLASHTGFKILRAEEFLTGNDPSEHTWGVCFILSKV